MLQPVVMRRSVNVSGFTVLLAVLVGSSLLGVLGALLAIPVAGSVQIGLREVLEARRQRVARCPRATTPSSPGRVQILRAEPRPRGLERPLSGA